MAGNRDIVESYEFNYYENMRCLKFLAHAIFPEFERTYTGPLREKWDRLKFYADIWDQGSTAVNDYPEIFSPFYNENLAVVYLYRNPLDNCVSAFHHYSGHVSEGHRIYVEKSTGLKKIFESPSEYLRNGGLDGYIKQFFTFHAMREHPNLLMVRYEDLINSPEQTFAKILSAIEFPIDSELKLQALIYAASMAAPGRIQQYEQANGRPLANDQLDASSSHVRGGQIGKWKSELSDEDVTYCMDRLDEFGLRRDDFIFE